MPINYFAFEACLREIEMEMSEEENRDKKRGGKGTRSSKIVNDYAK